MRAARTDADAQGLAPERAIYRVVLHPPDDANKALPQRQALRGTVVIDGEAESLVVRAWRRSVAVLLRKTGFGIGWRPNAFLSIFNV